MNMWLSLISVGNPHVHNLSVLIVPWMSYLCLRGCWVLLCALLCLAHGKSRWEARGHCQPVLSCSCMAQGVPRGRSVCSCLQTSHCVQDQAPLSHGDRYTRGLKEAEKVSKITMQFLLKRDKYWWFEEGITKTSSLVLHILPRKKKRKIQPFFPCRQ